MAFDAPLQIPAEADSPKDSLAWWLAAEREPVFFSDNPREWAVLEAHWEGREINFIYLGGSTPGEPRRVVPMKVFRVAGQGSVYFTGWCQVRGEERTFRLDKIQSLNASF